MSIRYSAALCEFLGRPVLKKLGRPISDEVERFRIRMVELELSCLAVDELMGSRERAAL